MPTLLFPPPARCRHKDVVTEPQQVFAVSGGIRQMVVPYYGMLMSGFPLEPLRSLEPGQNERYCLEFIFLHPVLLQGFQMYSQVIGGRMIVT